MKCKTGAKGGEALAEAKGQEVLRWELAFKCVRRRAVLSRVAGGAGREAGTVRK